MIVRVMKVITYTTINEYYKKYEKKNNLQLIYY